jgi:hypothetical protein
MFRAFLAHPQEFYTAWSAVVYGKCVAVWSCGLVSGGWYGAVRPPIALSQWKLHVYRPTFGNAESRSFLFAAQRFNTESMQKVILWHSCV